MSNTGYKGFTFGENDEHVGVKSKRWKGEAGNTYRFSFIFWPGLEKGKPDMDAKGPSFRGAQTHFIDKVGYVVNRGPEYTKLAGEPPRSRIGTIIVMWPTDKQGNLDSERVRKGDGEIKTWIFSDDKYKSLSMIHREFHFGQHDVTVSCTDTQYQKLTFSPCKENLLRKLMGTDKGREIVERLVMEAQEVASNLDNEVGREMTIEQIKAAQAGAPVGKGSGGGSASTGAPDAAVTGDIDDLVGDLLDK